MIGPALNLHPGAGFFLRGFLSLGLQSEFSFLLDELPTKAANLVNQEQIGFKPPTTRHCTTTISDKTTPRRERFSGWDFVTNRGCVEKQVF